MELFREPGRPIMKVSTAIVTGYGINADYELAEAFHRSGSEVTRIHINDLIARPAQLEIYHILAFPGGFSFGDHISSGLVFANLCRKHLRKELNRFRDAGKLIIGICNGFQILVKMGILPDISGSWEHEVSLVHNDRGLFIDKWVRVTADPGVNTIWTDGVDVIDLPIRHGEGKFIVKSDALAETLEEKQCIVLRYSGDNPNGSVNNIAGITDTTGRIFGLMPHPEAYLIPQNHPFWTHDAESSLTGLIFFTNAVKYVRNNLNN